jgi:glycosyltransferase involved in cell wall biosynthesis
VSDRIRSSLPCRRPPHGGRKHNRRDSRRRTIISSTRDTDAGSIEDGRTGADEGTASIPLPTQRRAPVVVDGSWVGRHGIGRFAAEVLPRMRVPKRFAGSGGSPASPKDVVAPWRLRLGRSDVVFTPGFNAGITRARQVLTLHDLIHLQDGDEAGRAKRVYYERLVRPAARRAGTVLTVSETSRAVIRSWLHDDDVDVVDVGNGCSATFFEEPSAQRSGTDLLYVGNLKPHKNPAPVFAALRAVPHARLTVVASDIAAVRAISRSHGVEDRVRVVASCTDGELRDLYAASAALVLPSLREGFGLPAVEALAVGTPVIHWAGCTSVGEIVDGRGVALEDAGDPDAWADAMIAALRGDLATSRPQGWAERWSWDAVAGRVDRAVAAAASR